jgi:hypothetical protein
MAYDRKVGISDPPAGSAPMGKPIAVPRIHGPNERRQSSRFSHNPPAIGLICAGACRNRLAT